MTDLATIQLPKWPALLVKGAPVTPAQAAKILIRTDCYVPLWIGGNDHDHCRRLEEVFGLPNGEGVYTLPEPAMRSHHSALFALAKDLRHLDLQYLANERIVTYYCGGPHGWCNWDGAIGACTYNIGKWPTVEEVTNDWLMIAKEFPFLDLECQLCNHECTFPREDQVNGPVVKFVVKDGKVTVLPQTPGQDAYIVEQRDDSAADFGTEIGISIEDLRSKLVAIYGTIPQYRLTDTPPGHSTA